MLKPNYHITILEKSTKLLSKVKVSGGGRCNVTNHCLDNNELIKNYPRGYKELNQVFSKFNVQHTSDWFKKQGVVLKTEADDRMFPDTNSSQTIIDCFMHLSKKLNISIQINSEVLSIEPNKDKFNIITNLKNYSANAIICALGGHNKTKAYNIIKQLGHNIIEPIPSLFTFNLPNESIKNNLQGISVKNAQIKIVQNKLNYNGPVLITHWGLSGPAVLKLSAFAATDFYKQNYFSDIMVNWVYPLKPIDVELFIKQFQKNKHKALPFSQSMFDLPKRLWEFLCIKSDILNTKPWAEVNNKQINKLVQCLCNYLLKMEGKTTFKEEFVSCGGVSLKEINFKTMESKLVPNLFFCGEVLNIDGITGGFNFQSAWSTAWICAESIN